MKFFREIFRDNMGKFIIGIAVSLFGIAGICLLLGFPFSNAIAIVALTAATAILIVGASVFYQKRKFFALNKKIDKLIAIDKKQTQQFNQSQKILSDIAGSVGRAAPLIRDIEKQVSQGNDASTVAAGANPVLQEKATRTQKRQPAANLVEVETRKASSRTTMTAMVIADAFTADAFSPEWNQLLPTPDNWLAMLTENSIDLLFIESAWEGNHGAWKYHLVGKTAPRPAVVELIRECKSRSIPVVFWNKEDPPHFEDFLPTAKLADIVFTTEGRLIEEYKHILGHENIHVLPFAAQPTLHNPARIKGVQRSGKVMFGGMYFQHKYPERRSQMEYLLPAASRVGLDIYSRQSDGAPEYQFPEKFKKDVFPSVPYSKMLAAYHGYKVVLNVNSVPDSETMCARRIFEATACGAAVVSAPSPAIDNFFPNHEITTASDEKTAYDRIRTLEKSDEFRDRLIHQAQRTIWKQHTYHHRVHQIAEAINYKIIDKTPLVSIIITTNRPASLNYLISNIVRQNHSPLELVLVTHGFEASSSQFRELEEKGVKVTLIPVEEKSTLGANLNILTDSAAGEILVRMDDDDWYGPHYVSDMVHALEYSGAGLVGKAATYIHFESMDATVLTYGAHEHRYTDFVRGATFTARKELLKKYRYAPLATSEDSDLLNRLKQDGVKIYSADRFNFVVNRWNDKGRHTWTVSDENLFASGVLKFYGNGQKEADV